MLQQLMEFFVWITTRDRTKWYTFSLLDVGLMFQSGVNHILTNGEDSAIGLWLIIIALNAIGTYFHNKGNK